MILTEHLIFEVLLDIFNYKYRKTDGKRIEAIYSTFSERCFTVDAFSIVPQRLFAVPLMTSPLFQGLRFSHL